jgi:hypothetical protein
MTHRYFYKKLVFYILFNFVFYKLLSGKNVDHPYKIIDGIGLYRKIVNPHPFKYLINPGQNICGQDHGKQVFLLIVVNTEPSRLQNRNTIRETWAKRTLFPDVRVLFLIGMPSKPKIIDRIKLESNLYQDILQEDFQDSYKNLTYKGIMSLKWASEYCSNAKYYMKTDDDVTLNLFTLLINLKKLKKNVSKSVICQVNLEGAMKVIRNPKSKWYLSSKDYKYKYFKTYCAGLAYIITFDLIRTMLSLSYHVRFIWIDDFFMSGILPLVAQAKYFTIFQYYSVFEHPKMLIEDILNRKSSLTKMVFHQKDQNVRNLIWFYVKEKMLNEYLFKTRYLYGEKYQLNEYCGYLDDYYWTHHDYWDKVLNKKFIDYKNQSFLNNSKFMDAIKNKWLFENVIY